MRGWAMAICLAWAWGQLWAAKVTVKLDDPPAGVRYAADQLEAVATARVTAELDAADLPDAVKQAGPEAFAIVPIGGGFRVLASAPQGLMYGLLELRDRLQYEDPPKEPVVSAPALRLRGDTFDFPFYLGVDLYAGRWRGAQAIERSPDSWWLDKNHWTWRLKRCAEYRINALLICHPHPFPALIDLPDYPEAAYFDKDHLSRLQDHFRWILDQADQYGVKIYFLTWNIWVSPGFAKAHNLPMEGPDSGLVRAYTQACYQRLFETYPKLAGVMTIAGEAPPGCVAFVKDAIVGGLNRLASPPELIYWTWCSYPEDAREVLAAYRGKGVVGHYLQYEQLFRPQADPRIRMTSEALGGVPVVTIGGLGTATGWLYWSDPYYIRDIMADLPRQNGDGCFFQGLDSFDFRVPKWLGWQGLARYWWDPTRPREDSYWRRRIAAHYGIADAADDFLEASIAASAIPTRLLALLHRQTDHYMPQFGLPLIHYLGLPTLSTYVFENHEGIDAQGRLTPRLGLTWPNPDWGEKVVGIVDYVRGSRDGTTPPQIADELQQAAQEVLGRLRVLREQAGRASVGAEKWNWLCDQLEMNAWLGLHTAEKIRAAIGWLRWRQGQGAPDEFLPALERSVVAMERMAQAAERLYGGIDIWTYRNCISRPIPWTHLQIWTTDQWRRHSFSDSAAMFRRELEWIRREVEAGYAQPLLPFEDDLAAPPPNAKLLVDWNFEGDPPTGIKVNSFPPNAVARLDSGEAPAPLTGRRLIADHQGDNFWFPVTTDPAALPLKIGKTYRVELDYWIIRDAEALGDWLSAGARTTAGGWQKDIGARYMGGPAGTRGHITITFTPHTWDDYYVYVSIHGPARVEFDNLRIWEGEGGLRPTP